MTAQTTVLDGLARQLVVDTEYDQGSSTGYDRVSAFSPTPSGSGHDNAVGEFTLFVSDTATPLPATLPLFATGLGALGLLGWRRKRKTVPLNQNTRCRQ